MASKESYGFFILITRWLQNILYRVRRDIQINNILFYFYSAFNIVTKQLYRNLDIYLKFNYYSLYTLSLVHPKNTTHVDIFEDT